MPRVGSDDPNLAPVADDESGVATDDPGRDPLGQIIEAQGGVIVTREEDEHADESNQPDGHGYQPCSEPTLLRSWLRCPSLDAVIVPHRRRTGTALTKRLLQEARIDETLTGSSTVVAASVSGGGQASSPR